jgi:hypothetical protein
MAGGCIKNSEVFIGWEWDYHRLAGVALGAWVFIVCVAPWVILGLALLRNGRFEYQVTMLYYHHSQLETVIILTFSCVSPLLLLLPRF